jgi:hypothetical protein
VNTVKVLVNFGLKYCKKIKRLLAQIKQVYYECFSAKRLGRGKTTYTFSVMLRYCIITPSLPAGNTLTEIQRKHGKYVGVSGERVCCFTLTQKDYLQQLSTSSHTMVIKMPSSKERLVC